MLRAKIADGWKKTGSVLKELNETSVIHPLRAEFETVLKKAEINNPWFTPAQLAIAFKGITQLLDPLKFDQWLSQYSEHEKNLKDVGVIMAGNIPMAGFHDMLCVLLSGNRLNAKLATADAQLIPFIAKIFTSFLPEMKERINFCEQLKNMDAVIATGSNNTSRYFEYYFGNKPHIFRKNRNSAAILNGTENEFDFILLGRDMFTYFGLGCRNVSKLYVPEKYIFDEMFQNLTSFGASLMDHNKYMNNFDYNQSILLLNQQPFLTNNFVIIHENVNLSSPVSVINFEYYIDEADLENKLISAKENIQCVVSKNGKIKFGQSQFPDISDYADEVNTMQFLLQI